MVLIAIFNKLNEFMCHIIGLINVDIKILYINTLVRQCVPDNLTLNEANGNY